MKKIYIYGAAFAAAFGLSACGDSSSAAAPSDKDSVAKSIDELSNCTAKKLGLLEDVAADVTTTYICADYHDKNQWIALSQTADYSDDFKVCNTTREGQYAVAMDELALFVCTDSEWEKIASFENIGKKEAETDDDDNVKSSSSKKKVVDDEEDDDEEEDVKSSSSKKTVIDDEDEEEEEDVKSSNSNDDDEEEEDVQPDREKVVTFVDGIIWQPSYGKRAWTGTAGVDEYNFLDNQADGGPGWWYKFLDNLDGGTSNAAGKFNDDNLTLNFQLVYDNWHYEYGMDAKGYEYSYLAPDPYPYAGFGFDLAKRGQSVSATKFGDGICVTYSSTATSRLIVASTNTESAGIHFYYPLEASSSRTTVNVKWKQFSLPSYAKDHYTILPSVSTSMNSATGIIFQYSNDEAGVSSCADETVSYCNTLAEAYGSNTLQIYKIGTYGSCNNTISDL